MRPRRRARPTRACLPWPSSTKPGARCECGAGNRLTCGPGEPNRLHQRHVAGDARGVGCLEVRGADAVAVEAAPHHGDANLHGIGAGLSMAGAAPESLNPAAPASTSSAWLEWVNFRLLARGPAGGAQSTVLLDRAVVTVGAVRRRGPERGAGLGGSGVAADAGGKELAMLPVVEALLRHPCHGGAAGERAEDEQQARAASGSSPASRARTGSQRRRESEPVGLAPEEQGDPGVESGLVPVEGGGIRPVPVSQYRAPPIARRSRLPALHSASTPSTSTEASLNRNSSGRSRVDP